MTLAIVTTYYNEVETIGDVVEALCKYPEPFLFFLVDDCSTSPPTEVLERYSKESWFHYLRNEKNEGSVVSSNRGIKAALEHDVDFIAINDSDDISYANRFPLQLQAFADDPDLMVIGGGADFVDQESGKHLWQTCHPADHADICRQHKINSAFVHSTVTYRARVFKEIGFYKEGYYAYDYEMLSRIIKAGFKTANIDKPILLYNVRMNSMSVSKRRTQVASRLYTQLHHLSLFDIWSLWGVCRTLFSYIAPNSMPSTLKIIRHRLKKRSS